MMYQVMLQTTTGWALFSHPTDNAHDAFELARLSSGYAPGMDACVLCGTTLAELQERCAQWQRDHSQRYYYPSTHPSTHPSAARTPPQTVERWHALMNAVELGPGGDHDEPYTYRPAPHREGAAAWVRLAARVTRGEIGGALDGSGDAQGQARGASDQRAVVW